jgi:hypothetical protein
MRIELLLLLLLPELTRMQRRKVTSQFLADLHIFSKLTVSDFVSPVWLGVRLPQVLVRC